MDKFKNCYKCIVFLNILLKILLFVIMESCIKDLYFLLFLKYCFDVFSFVVKCLNKVLKCICISNFSLVLFFFILLNLIYFYFFMMNLKFYCYLYSFFYIMIFLGILNLIFFFLILYCRVGMKMYIF